MTSRTRRGSALGAVSVLFGWYASVVFAFLAWALSLPAMPKDSALFTAAMYGPPIAVVALFIGALVAKVLTDRRGSDSLKHGSLAAVAGLLSAGAAGLVWAV